MEAVRNSRMSLIVASAIWPATLSLLMAGVMRDSSDVTAVNNFVNWLSSMAVFYTICNILGVRVLGVE